MTQEKINNAEKKENENEMLKNVEHLFDELLTEFVNHATTPFFREQGLPLNHFAKMFKGDSDNAYFWLKEFCKTGPIEEHETGWFRLKGIEKVKITLVYLHDVFRKWFHIEDTNRIDVVLAVALSNKMPGIPLWLIVVSKSGDMKSAQINALDDDEKTTKIIHRFTDKTLVNGHKDKSKFPDLAPKLDGKILLIPDMAEILNLHPSIKNEVWGQWRNLYDGYAGVQTGMGTDVRYKDLKVTMIAGSTPAIDDQILIHQSLGTRELMYRPKEIISITDLMAKAWKNEESEEEMNKEVMEVCQEFLDKREIREIQIPDFVEKEIKKMARWLTTMRATATIDSFTGELRGDVNSEQPTRVLKQLKRLYKCLKNLAVDYDDDTALDIIREVVESSADQIRVKVLDLLKKESPLSTSQVADRLRIGKKTAKTELSILWNLKLIDRRTEEGVNSYTGVTYVVKEEWSPVTESHI